MIFIYALFALAMLGYRVHSVALSRRMLRVRTESLATQRLARTFLALRDFTNTPLQTIELAPKIVRKRCPEMTPTLDRVDRSIDRLYRLNHAFSVYESRSNGPTRTCRRIPACWSTGDRPVAVEAVRESGSPGRLPVRSRRHAGRQRTREHRIRRAGACAATAPR